MRHPGLKILHGLMLAVSVTLAFLVLQDLDGRQPPGATAVIWIQDTRHGVSGAETARMISTFARGQRVSIVREVHDPRRPDSHRHLYIAAGDAGSAPASWLRRGYPDFGHRVRTDTRPFEQAAALDPRAMYQVYGSRRSVGELQAEFARLGLSGDPVRPTGFGEDVERYARSSLGSAYLVVLLSVVLTVGASVLLSAKGYGVLRLQGMSYLAILRWDLRRLAPFWFIEAAVATAVTLALLGWYNGFARLGLFAVVAGGLAGILGLLALVTHLGALALLARTGVARGLKGEVTAGPAMTAVYSLRIAAALLVLAIGGTTLASFQDFTQKKAGEKRFEALGEASNVALPGSRTEKAAEEMSVRVGRWLRRADERGQVIAVYRWRLEQFGPPRKGPRGGEVLFVNDTFLTEQPILGPSGKRYAPDPRAGVRVIIPERLREHAQVITHNVPVAIHPGDEGTLVRRSGVKQAWSKNGQTVFTFGVTSEGLTKPLVHDPVIVVIPNGSRLIADGDYTARATHNGIIFKNPEDILQAACREIPQEDIAAMTPVAQRAAQDRTRSADELRINGVSLAAALIVLFITGIGACVIHARRNAQAVFAKHISGWSFWTIHRRLFVLDAVVACGLLAWVAREALGRSAAISRFTDMGVPPPPGLPAANWWALVPAAGVAALATALLATALAFAHRRIVRERAADA
ncbi:hypothetical protein [Actinomadura sp. 3N508]|uniref:hypothetical protein n=1 Tax=Actinomadura sp. 3N508 TaxID=3375153 RepID=UPI0037AF1865